MPYGKDKGMRMWLIIFDFKPELAVREMIPHVVQVFSMFLLGDTELPDYPLAAKRKRRASAPMPTGKALHERLVGQAVDQIDPVPGRFVTDADRLGRLGYRTDLIDLLQ